MADTSTLNPEQCAAMLEKWRDDLSKWSAWIQAQSALLSNGNVPKDTIRYLVILRQHLALLQPWMTGIASALPPTNPNITITRCEYQPPDFIAWPQRITENPDSI